MGMGIDQSGQDDFSFAIDKRTVGRQLYLCFFANGYDYSLIKGNDSIIDNATRLIHGDDSNVANSFH